MKENEEWFYRNLQLAKEIIEYTTEYREKICSRCTAEEKKRRKCIEYGSSGITRCGHLDNAGNKKFRERISNELRTLT